MKTAAQMIRDYREERGITQIHISKVTGITTRRMSRLETGLSRMTADEFLNIIINGFGITPQIFFDNQTSKSESLIN